MGSVVKKGLNINLYDLKEELQLSKLQLQLWNLRVNSQFLLMRDRLQIVYMHCYPVIPMMTRKVIHVPVCQHLTSM